MFFIKRRDFYKTYVRRTLNSKVTTKTNRTRKKEGHHMTTSPQKK
jgi:hypothetical protein